MGSKILRQIGLDYVGMVAEQARERTDSIVCISIPTSKFLPGLPSMMNLVTMFIQPRGKQTRLEVFLGTLRTLLLLDLASC